MLAGSLLLERLAAAVQERGSMSAARRCALECIAAEPQRAWSAAGLRAACNAQHSGAISPASAYRVLELLCGLGLMQRLMDSATGALSFSLTPLALGETELVEHGAVNSRRRTVLAADRWLLRYAERLALRHGMTLESFRLELRGSFKQQRRRKDKG